MSHAEEGNGEKITEKEYLALNFCNHAYAAYNNSGVCSNWNALVAAAETKNKVMKTAVFTNLRYFFPLIKDRYACWRQQKQADSLKLIKYARTNDL